MVGGCLKGFGTTFAGLITLGGFAPVILWGNVVFRIFDMLPA